jgi:hypothetical protein
MNSKQLANVLVKILGLSLCVSSAAGIINGVFRLLMILPRLSSPYSPVWQSLLYPLSSLVTLGIGIYLIARSRWVVDKLFTSADE